MTEVEFTLSVETWSPAWPSGTTTTWGFTGEMFTDTNCQSNLSKLIMFSILYTGAEVLLQCTLWWWPVVEQWTLLLPGILRSHLRTVSGFHSGNRQARDCLGIYEFARAQGPRSLSSAIPIPELYPYAACYRDRSFQARKPGSSG